MPHKAALIGSCLASFIATALGAQTVPVDDLRIWARTHAHPITISDRDTGFTDLSPVAKIIGNARVVAFGEPIHGAHEPLAARNRLIRYLVTQQGFTAVALESSLSTSKRLRAHCQQRCLKQVFESSPGGTAQQPGDRRGKTQRRPTIRHLE